MTFIIVGQVTLNFPSAIINEIIYCPAAHLQDVRHFPDGEERLVGHAPVIAGLTC